MEEFKNEIITDIEEVLRSNSKPGIGLFSVKDTAVKIYEEIEDRLNLVNIVTKQSMQDIENEVAETIRESGIDDLRIVTNIRIFNNFGQEPKIVVSLDSRLNPGVIENIARAFHTRFGRSNVLLMSADVYLQVLKDDDPTFQEMVKRSRLLLKEKVEN